MNKNIKIGNFILTPEKYKEIGDFDNLYGSKNEKNFNNYLKLLDNYFKNGGEIQRIIFTYEKPNIENIGNSWTHIDNNINNYLQTILDFNYDERRINGDEDVYLIIAETEPKNINIEQSLSQYQHNWEEEEIHLINPKKIKIKNIKKIKTLGDLKENKIIKIKENDLINLIESKLNEKLMLSDFNEYAKLVADAYENAPDYDPSVVSSYKALIDSVKKMFKQLQSKVKIEFTNYDPYKTRDEMAKDVKDNGVLKISKLFNTHPIFTEEENLQLRACHDYFTHIIANQSFGLRGELRAYNTHSRLAPVAALPALFTEIVGQVCYAIIHGDFTKQKICKLEGFDFKEVGKIDNYDIVNKTLVKKEDPKLAMAAEEFNINETLSKDELYEAEGLLEDSKKFEFINEKQLIEESEYKGKKVPLGKPMRGDVKKYKVYVKNDKGNVVKVNFGDPNMEIKRDDPKRRKAFRDRHNCKDKKDRTSAGYWSCKLWSNKSVSDILKGK